MDVTISTGQARGGPRWLSPERHPVVHGQARGEPTLVKPVNECAALKEEYALDKKSRVGRPKTCVSRGIPSTPDKAMFTLQNFRIEY